MTPRLTLKDVADAAGYVAAGLAAFTAFSLLDRIARTSDVILLRLDQAELERAREMVQRARPAPADNPPDAPERKRPPRKTTATPKAAA